MHCQWLSRNVTSTTQVRSSSGSGKLTQSWAPAGGALTGAAEAVGRGRAVSFALTPLAPPPFVSPALARSPDRPSPDRPSPDRPPLGLPPLTAGLTGPGSRVRPARTTALRPPPGRARTGPSPSVRSVHGSDRRGGRRRGTAPARPAPGPGLPRAR